MVEHHLDTVGVSSSNLLGRKNADRKLKQSGNQYIMSFAMEPTRHSCIALIPAHNESTHLPGVVRACLRHLDHVVVVDDASTDETARLASFAGAQVLRLPRRSGKGAALIHGWDHLLQASHCPWLLVLDGDGQHPPENIPRFLKAAQNKRLDLIIGRRNLRHPRMPFLRRLTNQLMSHILSWKLRNRIDDSQCGFRLIHRDFLLSREWKSQHFEIESEMLFHARDRGWNVRQVDIPVIYEGEQSWIHPIQDTLRWISLLRKNPSN